MTDDRRTPRPRWADRPFALLIVSFCALWLIGCAAKPAPTHLLLMGGGAEPRNNQVSLEKNLAYFERVKGQLGLAHAQRDVLFACGNDKTQDDIQYLANASDDPIIMQMIDVLVAPGANRSRAYRPHELDGSEIQASPEHIAAWFDDQAQTLGPEDRVMVYFTGHGSKGPKDNPQNTGMYLWSKKKMPTQAFVGHLDKLDQETPVVLVMVQCYSGGFANVIFNEGNPDKGLSEHNRCGFFASVHDRVAAGCTPHVNEADYKEYSSYFWAALSGEDRMGQPINRPDYNGDGVTSYLEAHAYSMIHSNSIDLSMSTTDRLVRAVPLGAEEDQPGRLTADADYAKLLAAADPARRAVLEGLSERLGLTGEDRHAKAKAMVDEKKKQRDELKQKLREAGKTYHAQRLPLIAMLKDRWPDLINRKKRTEAIGQIIESHEAIKKIVCEHDAYAQTLDRLDDIQVLKEERESLATTLAHAERFVYTCESVANIDTLKQFGEQKHIDAYNQLYEREMARPGY